MNSNNEDREKKRSKKRGIVSRSTKNRIGLLKERFRFKRLQSKRKK